VTAPQSVTHYLNGPFLSLFQTNRQALLPLTLIGLAVTKNDHLNFQSNKVCVRKNKMVLQIISSGQFNQPFTSSFCARKSWKRKKYSQVVSLFCAFGIFVQKVARKTLMKMTPRRRGERGGVEVRIKQAWQ